MQRSWMLLLSCALLAIPQSSRAAKLVAVKDELLFSESARKQAAQIAQEIQDKFDVLVRIETFRDVPMSLLAPLQKKKVQAMNAAERQAFFADLARKQIKAFFAKSADNYVYVLICLEPGPVNVHVEVGPRAKRALSSQDADAMAKLVREKLTEKANDTALLDSMVFVRQVLTDHADALQSKSARLDWLSLMWVVGPILAIWLLCEAFRMMHPELRRADISAAVGHARGGSYPAALVAGVQSGDLKHLLTSLADFRIRRPVSRPQPHHAEGLDHDLAAHALAVDAELSGKLHGEP